jgi:hypothetical protein
MKRMLLMAAAAGAVAALAARAPAQAKALRYDLPAGTRRVLERTTRTETVVKSEDQTSRRVTEVPVRREILVVESTADPAQMRLVTLETPVGERLLALEENGQDRMRTVPEDQRVRPLPPLLAAHRCDLTGRPTGEQPVPDAPMAVIDRAIAELRFLPVEPVGPGTDATRRLDLGIAALETTTRQVEVTPDDAGDTPAVVLETTARLTFTGDWAKQIRVTTLTARSAWAADGSGLLSQRGTLVLDETAGDASQHLTRNWEERLQETGRLAPSALSKALENLETLEKAMADARAGNLDAAVDALKAYVEANPDGAWTPAVASLRTALTQRRLLSQPLPEARLRLMLRDLQASRDQAGARGDAPRVAQIDQGIRQVATVNAKQILMDAANPDPIVRDLATFALGFLQDPQAAERLTALASDASAQVRGTALVSLAIRGQAMEKDALLARLGDESARVRGAAALLASQTLERGSETAAALLEPLAAVLSADMTWARSNAAIALGRLAPKDHVATVQALVEAHERESEDALKRLYRAAMEEVTGRRGDNIAPFKKWLETKGAAVEAPKG